MKLTDLTKLNFIPASTDLGLLALRVWLGLSMFLIHGLAKLTNFSGTVTMFHDKMGIPTVFGAAAVLAESVCSLLLVIGLFTRWAALFLGITMAVAFVKVHQLVLTQGNPQSGELAFLYFGGFLALMLAGGGQFAVKKDKVAEIDNRDIGYIVGGSVAGLLISYPISYFLQPGLVRMVKSLPSYITGVAEVMKEKELSSTVVLCALIGIVLGAIVGFMRRTKATPN